MVKVLAVILGSLALMHPGIAQNGSELQLTGVVVSGPASLAIIAGPDGREKVYRLGHEIQPGATLEEVSPGGAIVMRDRRREWLPLVRGAAPQYHAPIGAAQGLMRPPEPAAAGIAPRGVEPQEPRRARATAEPARQITGGPGADGK